MLSIAPDAPARASLEKWLGASGVGAGRVPLFVEDHSGKLFFSLSLSLSLCHAHTHTHTHTVSLSFSLPLSLSLSLSLSHTPRDISINGTRGVGRGDELHKESRRVFGNACSVVYAHGRVALSFNSHRGFSLSLSLNIYVYMLMGELPFLLIPTEVSLSLCL